MIGAAFLPEDIFRWHDLEPRCRRDFTLRLTPIFLFRASPNLRIHSFHRPNDLICEPA